MSYAKAQRTIKIENSVFIFNDKESVPIAETNLPNDLLFRKQTTYVRIQIDSYFLDARTLRTTIIDYCAKPETFQTDTPLKKPIEKLHFQNLNWESLKSLLSVFKEIDFQHTLRKADQDKFKNLMNSELSPDNEFLASTQCEPIAQELKPVKRGNWTETDSFLLSLSEVNIIEGGISFYKSFDFQQEPLQIQIQNPYFKKEFDLIKSQLWNALSLSRIMIETTFYFHDNELLDVVAKSAVIEGIDNTFISQLRLNIAQSLGRISAPQDRMSKLHKLHSIPTLGNQLTALNISEAELISANLKNSNTRNKEQILFLSRMQTQFVPILFTLKPEFGFVFQLLVNNKLFLVWELLNSHATYLWSNDQQLAAADFIFAVEEDISLIFSHGRLEYIKKRKEELSLSSFTRIQHIFDQKENHAFKKWKQQIERILFSV